MQRKRKNGRETRLELKQMQKRSIIYALYTAKDRKDYTSAKRIGV